MANAITLSGTSIPAASAADPSLCRVSGYLTNGQGKPLSGWAFTLRYVSPAGLAAGTIVLQERMSVKADAAGYVEFDLLRGAVVTAELPNLLLALNSATLLVPNASSIELMAFLFPYIASVAWVDPGPVSVAQGATFVVALQGTLTNGEVVDMTSSSVTITSSDGAIVTLSEGFSYRGVAAGAVTLTVDSVNTALLGLQRDREGSDIVFLGVPSPSLPSPLSVTVT